MIQKLDVGEWILVDADRVRYVNEAGRPTFHFWERVNFNRRWSSAVVLERVDGTRDWANYRIFSPDFGGTVEISFTRNTFREKIKRL